MGVVTFGLQPGGQWRLRIDLELAGAAGTGPTIRVRLTGGYDSGSDTLTGGSVNIAVPGRAHNAAAPSGETTGASA